MRNLRHVGLATAVLSDEEINYIDKKIVETVRPMLIARQLFPVTTLAHAGFRIVTFYEEGDMSAAVIDMEGQEESLDRVALTPKTVTVPVIHKETLLYWRDLAMSRENGTPIDVQHVKNAARQVAEDEDLLLLSGEHTGFPAFGVQGLTTITGRLTGAGGDWVNPGTSYNCLTYVATAIQALENVGHYGPYKLIVPPTFYAQLRTPHPDLRQWLFDSMGDLLGGTQNILTSPNLLANDDGAADSAIVMEGPNQDNTDLLVGEDSHSRTHELKNGNIWAQVREVVAPRIRRPASVYEITSLT